MNPIQLSLFSNRIAAVCDEMGTVLQHAAFSPNIRDRLDYSCAVFDAEGELCAQAAHIPVHLGSMAFAMRDVIQVFDWQEGDIAIFNDPFLGGTHLPDVTLVAPLFIDNQIAGFVANRAHHADIGAESPGSMPISSTLEEEGLVIPPTLLMQQGEMQEHLFSELISGMRNPIESRGDFTAQISSAQTGVKRLMGLIRTMGAQQWQDSLIALNNYAEKMARSTLNDIPQGEYRFSDVMDDDGLGNTDIPIHIRLSVTENRVLVDFAGTADQVAGNINCPLSVAAAAVFYVFRCLMPEKTPACAGSFRPIQITAPEGCLVNARRPAATAAGNVETSTRIVDVVLGALALAIPERIPAASHGSMNNLAMGSSEAGQEWDYYETIGGGMGAHSHGDGLSAVQTHMTNTLNTPIEALEMRYPLRINQYGIRRGSGGKGEYSGGDGIIRQFEFLGNAQVTLLTERRRHQPWGLKNANDGKTGENRLNDQPLDPKTAILIKTGDQLEICTPGGGGYADA